LIGEVRLALAVSMQNASPSVTLAIRIVRSFSGRQISLAQLAKAFSTVRFISASSVSSCSRGPVPTQSLASVSTIPRA